MSKLVQRFCNTCGQLMYYTRSIAGYNMSSGKPDYEYVFRCRNSRWYKIGHASLTLYVYPEYWDREEENNYGD